MKNTTKDQRKNDLDQLKNNDELPVAMHICKAEFKISGPLKIIKRFFDLIIDEDYLELDEFSISFTEAFQNLEDWKTLEAYLLKRIEKKSPKLIRDTKILKIRKI